MPWSWTTAPPSPHRRRMRTIPRPGPPPGRQPQIAGCWTLAVIVEVHLHRVGYGGRHGGCHRASSRMGSSAIPDPARRRCPSTGTGSGCPRSAGLVQVPSCRGARTGRQVGRSGRHHVTSAARRRRCPPGGDTAPSLPLEAPPLSPRSAPRWRRLSPVAPIDRALRVPALNDATWTRCRLGTGQVTGPLRPRRKRRDHRHPDPRGSSPFRVPEDGSGAWSSWRTKQGDLVLLRSAWPTTGDRCRTCS